MTSSQVYSAVIRRETTSSDNTLCTMVIHPSPSLQSGERRYRRSLFIFRRDLRIEDNTALAAATSSSAEILLCFILDDRQVLPHSFRSGNGLAFMEESLSGLEKSCAAEGATLVILRGPPETTVNHLLREGSFDAIFVNKDYTPFSRQRDRALADVCNQHGVNFHSFSDSLLLEPSSFGKPNGEPYTIYTPFYKRGVAVPVNPVSINSLAGGARSVPAPNSIAVQNLVTTIADGLSAQIGTSGTAAARRSIGGRSNALPIVASIHRHENYTTERDIPSLDATTILAPHNKFGTVSIREVYWAAHRAFGADCTLIRELYWRDFFTHIAWHFPHVFTGAFHREYNNLPWEGRSDWLAAWQHGTTGFPIVDAGMRELVASGFMHNRVRMIVASFLVKDLHIDWHEGERFFATHLTEYDPAVNNGNWQWAASTGCDAQPYFRIFNPWLQQKRFDPDALYIKRWVPELRPLSAQAIHRLGEDTAQRPTGYPRPIVAHSHQKARAEEMFRKIRLR